VNPGLGGRQSLRASSTFVSVAALTTGPSGTAVRKTREPVQERVETRDRILPKEEKRTVNEGASRAYERECLGLDVHKGSITATHLGPGGTVMKTWTFQTTRPTVSDLVKQFGPQVPVVLEASTAGKAVAGVLKAAGMDLHMGAPNRIAAIAQAPVKTDERDSATLAHLYQAGFLPECYVPPPEIDRMRLLVRGRRDLADKVTRVKNQIHAQVTRNLLDSEMVGVSDIFGLGGMRKLTRLPFPPLERVQLAHALAQLKMLADQEEALQGELARLGEERTDVRRLMTIPGIGYYTAVGIVAEIGDIHRFATKKNLCSYAGLVSKADNSGQRVSEHRRVKPGNMTLKHFLCLGVTCMLKAGRETRIKVFYAKKAKQIGAAKAQVAAARKLACAIWKMLTDEVSYADEDEELTARKGEAMKRDAKELMRVLSEEELQAMGEIVAGKAEVFDRLSQEAGDAA
jgi:transposase